MERPIISLIDYFVDLPDPRLDRGKLHCLTDIMYHNLRSHLWGAILDSSKRIWPIKRKLVQNFFEA